MKLADYIKDMARREALAAAVNSSPDYLWQVATGWQGRKPSIDLARRIQDATDGAVNVVDMRPDLAEAIAAAGYTKAAA